MAKQDILNTLKDFQLQQANNNKMVDCITLAYHIISAYDPEKPFDEENAIEIINKFYHE